ncbi:TPA: hypothetical protein I7702_16795 [Vibrio vulnificus]|nr:hypothetical protein [Vibrio vulnificus]HAS8460818.1 hypothetical protein [Vibrio vulnificus]
MNNEKKIARQKRYREKNKARLAEQYQHKKTYNQFINELATDLNHHDAEFLTEFNKKYSFDPKLVATEYLNMITDLGLSHQRRSAKTKPAIYKALFERCKTKDQLKENTK